MHTEKQTFNINYLHWLHLHSEKIKWFFLTMEHVHALFVTTYHINGDINYQI